MCCSRTLHVNLCIVSSGSSGLQITEGIVLNSDKPLVWMLVCYCCYSIFWISSPKQPIDCPESGLLLIGGMCQYLQFGSVCLECNGGEAHISDLDPHQRDGWKQVFGYAQKTQSKPFQKQEPAQLCVSINVYLPQPCKQISRITVLSWITVH